MKNVYLLIICSFFWGLNVFAQKEKAFDYVIPDDESIKLFYVEKDSVTQINHFFENGKYKQKVYKLSKSTFLKNTQNLILQKQLKKLSQKTIEKQLIGKKLQTLISTKHRYDNYNSYFFNKNILIYYEVDDLTDNEIIEFIYEREKVKLSSYAIQYINNYPFLFLLDDGGDSYMVVPFLKKNNPYIVMQTPITETKKAQLLSVLNYNNITVEKKNDNYGLYIKYGKDSIYNNKKRKYQKSTVTLKKLLPPVFDTIKLTKPIITKKGKNVSLYNVLNERYPIENIRAINTQYIYGFPNGFQAIQKNDLIWLNKKGEIVNIKKLDSIIRYVECDELEDYFYEYSIHKSESSISLLSYKIKYNSTKVNRNNDFDIYDTISTTKKHLFNRQKSDSAYFLNKKNSFISRDFLISKKDKLYNLYSYKIDNYNPLNSSLGDIIVKGLGKQPIGYYDYSIIFIEKNGLKGYYPFTAIPKYKNLSEFNFYFARFTLPNGKQGWLDLHGNEYLDE